MPAGSNGRKVHVETQVRQTSTEGTALCLDLVAELVDMPDARPLWVEVKVYAGEHGNQLTHYENLAASISPPAQVITLARSLEVKQGVKGITWRDLAEAIEGDSHLYWQELLRFMNGKRMLLHSEDPITPSDITALASTLDTLDKMTERLHLFASKAAKRSVPIHFRQNRGSIRRILGAQLGRHQRLCLPSRDANPSLLVGLRWFGAGPKKQARLMFCVEHNPKEKELRNRLLQTADQNGLSKDWVPETVGWPGLLKSGPIDVENGSLHGSETWWSNALDELESAKILEMISGGSPPDADADADADDL